MSGVEADRWAWLLVLSFVFGCNVLRILLPSFSSFMSRLLQKDAEQEAQMRAEIQNMKQELSTVNMMDEFARYARLERKINKMTDKLKTHVKARTAQLAKIKWVISVAFYILQAALMVSLIWKYYSVPVAVVPSKWITPLDRLVAFPTRVAVHTQDFDRAHSGQRRRRVVNSWGSCHMQQQLARPTQGTCKCPSGFTSL
ncbi:tail-anchored protein insertion receptor WRB isoform X4 [Eumetopias jubatus]|uniref:tail-anchored protein insertion receptor WRB isoform X4 n=2 Tax=Eumetopias jubatus TaxID=34886 RepID=UPI001015CBA1|nr:tail-anchored protein insertion receptor WRB isoform X4 [Eumetopias jubatus]